MSVNNDIGRNKLFSENLFKLTPFSSFTTTITTLDEVPSKFVSTPGTTLAVPHLLCADLKTLTPD